MNTENVSVCSLVDLCVSGTLKPSPWITRVCSADFEKADKRMIYLLLISRALKHEIAMKLKRVIAHAIADQLRNETECCCL